jgi:hypothetical protein
MEQFTKPINLNGEELRAELNAAGVAISEEIDAVTLIGNDLFLDISKTDRTKAEAIVKAHNGTIIPKEPTITEKLASVGLSVADLKTALGL